MKTRIALSVLILSSFVSSPGVASGSEATSPGSVVVAAVAARPDREATLSRIAGSDTAVATASLQDGGEPAEEHRHLLRERVGQVAVYADTDAGLDDAAWAIGRFVLAGLPLPAVEVYMSSEQSACNDSAAYLTDLADGTLVIRSCGTRFTLLHELGHAWDMGFLTDHRREAFMRLRGLESWNNPQNWDQAAGEHAATAIAWGLNERRVNQWSVQPSDPDSMRKAFVLLTGQRPLWEKGATSEHAPLDAVELQVATSAPVAEPASEPDATTAAAAADRGIVAERLQLDAAEVQTLDKRDLRAVADGRGRVGFLQPEAAVAFRAMRDAASQAGVPLRFTSAWRSWTTQDRAYRHFTETGTNLAGNPVPNVAHPDSSNHPRGLALDFALNDQVTVWLNMHAADHGWYTISSEAWHWEYRGQDTYHDELTARPPAPIPTEDRQPTEPQVLI